MKNDKWFLWVLAPVLVGVVGVLLYWPAKRRVETVHLNHGPAKGGVAAQAQAGVSNAVASAVKPGGDVLKKSSGSGPAAKAGEGAGQQTQTTNEVKQTADQAAAELMQERLDDNDAAGALKLARKLMKSTEASVRSDVVSVLGMIGVKALPELTEMMDDGDKDISKEAFQQWMARLDELENDDMKQQMLTAKMMALDDIDTLEECAMAFSGMDEAVVINGLLPVIESNNPIASKVAREHYEHVTGEEYTTADAARKLAEQQSNDNVQPPADPKK